MLEILRSLIRDWFRSIYTLRNVLAVFRTDRKLKGVQGKLTEHSNNLSLIIRDAACNKTKSFFNANGLMVEKIDQENDIGIDAVLTLARSGPDAGLSVNLQIKGGRKYKRRLHVNERYRRIGYASHRQVDWQLSADITPPCGFEGHHVVDMDSRLRVVWRNRRRRGRWRRHHDHGPALLGVAASPARRRSPAKSARNASRPKATLPWTLDPPRWKASDGWRGGCRLEAAAPWLRAVPRWRAGV